MGRCVYSVREDNVKLLKVTGLECFCTHACMYVQCMYLQHVCMYVCMLADIRLLCVGNFCIEVGYTFWVCMSICLNVYLHFNLRMKIYEYEYIFLSVCVRMYV